MAATQSTASARRSQVMAAFAAAAEQHRAAEAAQQAAVAAAARAQAARAKARGMARILLARPDQAKLRESMRAAADHRRQQANQAALDAAYEAERRKWGRWGDDRTKHLDVYTTAELVEFAFGGLTEAAGAAGAGAGAGAGAM